ncbi:hypothetical protein [Mycolicibacterium fluoranthenivorans]|uniref:Phenylacetate-coenzyme A ligase PaaK-like adenylate-forming protein n=1 Tax=Mycolicibacterium fluoranthenivorans TaxID=258505 RepID=A0A7X5TYK9_9MYCO|nr:hypothetical protein [Mycolicibacterium fluoranthenivorans]MCV7358965.1 hypothetical protein [Mycolicibacterium fluoranthenivorans]NIH95087.1 phenylacetate-coenzyme A ligase PaaK-like adenylate-forming protein [Mycolicibacterium fluoranthenivorans]
MLITYLANRIQPIIRYRMGDRVAMDADPCICGSPFPSIQVVGRTHDILTFPTRQGEEVRILPLAIATVAEETPGVTGCQLIQCTPSSLTVRLRVKDGGDREAVWAELRNRLAAFLSAHGATTVRAAESSARSIPSSHLGVSEPTTQKQHLASCGHPGSGRRRG